MATTTAEQQYGPSSGSLSGVLGLVVCAALLVALAVGGHGVVQVRWMLAVVALAVVTWAFLLRPLITVKATAVVLRNPFSSWTIPLASVTSVQVKAYTRIGTEGRSYDSVAVGRRVRKMLRPARGPAGGRPGGGSERLDTSTPEGLADLLIEQVLQAAEDARRRGEQPGPGTRSWAVPELAVLAAAVLALVVSFAF